MADLMREQFEAWSGPRSDKSMFVRGPHIGKYKNPVMQSMWKAWLASREAVVVELPSLQCLRVNQYDYQEARQQCIKAIEAQGLKVAP